jgi:hypothetical protein
MGRKRGKMNTKNDADKSVVDNNCLEDLCWTVDVNTTYKPGDGNVFSCNNKNYNIQNYFAFIKKTKKFKKLPETIQMKFSTAIENGKNVKLIFHKNKTPKVLKLAELTIANYDIRMIARKRYERKLNDKNFYLLVFEETANHAEILKIRQTGSEMQTIDV